ncbi:hypothetical protein AVEN_50383-1 [Araneus ventricosus]|uniref:Uncharacterized protein n=1 Tax=Araneus ventricosus TaxID=182803 RepID=A0A4Y2UUD4_ARAVE|nr:hypothetical protein AVEN_50383-1 [Araneus ventricosus]
MEPQVLAVANIVMLFARGGIVFVTSNGRRRFRDRRIFLERIRNCSVHDVVVMLHCSLAFTVGNQSIGQYLSIHKDSISNPPTNRRLEEAVVVDWPKMIKFKTS